MRTRLFSTLTIAALAMTACGGGGGGAQGEVADLFIELAGDEGIELDRSCVEDAAEGLSDDDAQKIVDAGVDGDPDVSADAEAVGSQMFNCVDVGSYVDNIVGQFDGDESVDGDCLRSALSEVDTVDEIDEIVIDAALECSS